MVSGRKNLIPYIQTFGLIVIQVSDPNSRKIKMIMPTVTSSYKHHFEDSVVNILCAWFHLRSDFTSRQLRCSHFIGWRNWGLERSEDISSSICLQRTAWLVCSSSWVRKKELLVCFYSSLFGEPMQVSLAPCFGQSSISRPLVVKTAFVEIFEDSSAVNALPWGFMRSAIIWMVLGKCGEFWIHATVLICPTLR